MLKIKKYANGQFFDTINKKYIKVATLKEMIQKGEKIKVTLTKTGKDITASVVEQLSKKSDAPKTKKGKKVGKKSSAKSKKAPFLNTESLKKWAGKIIDKRVNQVLETVKLPNRKQIEELDANIKALNKKIDKLEMLQKKKAAKAKTAKETAAPEAKKAKTTTAKTDTAQTVTK
ncbi:MAG: polyhydroxyalkanoate synthesis regulator DNA-binding domain-containing protein [Thermodesulfobacteriota bacterium]